jgi:hypothetical protein
MWATEHIQWFATRNQDWIDAYIDAAQEYGAERIPDEEYFVYSDEQSGYDFRVEYLQTALAISDTGDSCIYLLNPQVVTPDGEWEGWFFSNWGGALRYRSFWEMMLAERQRFLNLTKRE